MSENKMIYTVTFIKDIIVSDEGTTFEGLYPIAAFIAEESARRYVTTLSFAEDAHGYVCLQCAPSVELENEEEFNENDLPMPTDLQWYKINDEGTCEECENPTTETHPKADT